MERIEAEGARMGLLVEDLLLLARLDQQRPLTFAPVDLAAIAGDAVHDARAVQPDRPIVLHLDESLTDVPVVLGDEGRLRQVVGNLVTNALTHTPAGDAGHRDRGARTPTTRTCSCCGSPTRGRAWTRPTPSGRSSASTAPTPPGPARAGGTGLGLAIVVLAGRGARRLGRPGHRPGPGRRRHRPAAPLRPAGRAPAAGADGGDAEPV